MINQVPVGLIIERLTTANSGTTNTRDGGERNEKKRMNDDTQKEGGGRGGEGIENR